jgi:hypothetical protein
MATRSPIPTHSYWGTYANPAALAAIIGDPRLQAGDTAFSLSDALPYVFDGAAWIMIPALATSPTVAGQVPTWNGTAWVPAVGGGLPIPQRPPIDANHTNVWYMGAGCTTTGLDILPDVGGVTLNRSSGTGTISTGYGCFTTQQSVLCNDSTAAISEFTGAISIGPTAAFSAEAIIYMDQYGLASMAGLTNFLILNNSLATPEGAFFRYFNSSGQAEVASARQPGTQIFNFQASAGNTPGTFQFGMKCHYMLTWNPATPRVELYINGVLVNSTTNASFAGNRSGTIDTIFLSLWSRGVSLADVRISNIARPQSYAIAATQAMLAL